MDTHKTDCTDTRAGDFDEISFLESRSSESHWAYSETGHERMALRPNPPSLFRSQHKIPRRNLRTSEKTMAPFSSVPSLEGSCSTMESSDECDMRFRLTDAEREGKNPTRKKSWPTSIFHRSL